MAKKELALLTLQSLIYLPVLIFLTKGTVVVLVIAVICGIFYVRSRLSFKPFNVWTLLLVTGAVSAIWSITPEQSLERAVKLALFLLLLGGLVHVVNRWSEADRLYLAELGRRAWLVSLLIVLPLVIFEGELKTSLVSAFPGQETKDFVLVWKPVSNAAVIILVVTAFPLLGHAISTGSAKKYVFLSLVGLFAAVFASGSTSALFGLVAGLFVWCLYARYTRQTAKFLTVALPLSVLAMPILVYPLANNPEFIDRSIPYFPNSFIHRLHIWDFTLDRIAERPLLGWGLDTSRAIPGVPIFVRSTMSSLGRINRSPIPIRTCRCTRTTLHSRSGWNWG